MKYKRSRYNVEVDKLEDGKKLIYNTYTGVFGIMDIETQNIYEDIENTDISNIDNIELQKNINIMKNTRYIVPAEIDELSSVRLQRASSRYTNQVLSLTIAPTLDCNMACPYCYEGKSKLVMSEETQNDLVKFVKSHFERYPSIKSLSICWYGGEPLMQKEAIYNLSEKFIEICNEEKIPYYANIVTNGVFLDAETSKKLVNDCKVSSAQITIDGMRDTHNKRRILMNGEDSFGVIVSNIDNCDKGMQIAIRVNVDKENSKEIEKLTKFFIEEKGWGHNPMFYFAPVGKYNESCDIEEVTCMKGPEFASENNQYLKLNYSLNRESALKHFYPKVKKTTFCSAENTLNYVIDPQGYYYNCWHHVGDSDFKTGDIKAPFMPTEKYMEWMLLDLSVKCEKCEYLPLCQGGCGVYRLGGEEAQCHYSYYGYKETLKLAYEDYKLRKSKPAHKNIKN